MAQFVRDHRGGGVPHVQPAAGGGRGADLGQGVGAVGRAPSTRRAGGGCRPRATKPTAAAASFHSAVGSAQPAVVVVQSWAAVTPSSIAPLLCSDQKSATGPSTGATTRPGACRPRGAGRRDEDDGHLVGQPAARRGPRRPAGRRGEEVAGPAPSGRARRRVRSRPRRHLRADGERDGRAGRDAGDVLGGDRTASPSVVSTKLSGPSRRARRPSVLVLGPGLHELADDGRAGRLVGRGDRHRRAPTAEQARAAATASGAAAGWRGFRAEDICF